VKNAILLSLALLSFACNKPAETTTATPPKTPTGPAATSTTAAVPAKIKDPVCGMEIETAAAVTTTHEGKTYYFCSDNCRQQFKADPAKYTAAK
jgi:YHS domain-containing protein